MHTTLLETNRETSLFPFDENIKTPSQTNFPNENFAEIFRISGKVCLETLEKKVLLFLREPKIQSVLPFSQGFLVSDSISTFLLIYGFRANIPTSLAQDIIYQLQLTFPLLTWTIYRTPKKQKDKTKQTLFRRLRSLRGAIMQLKGVIQSKPQIILPLHADYEYFEYNYQLTKLNRCKDEIAVRFAPVGNKKTNRSEILQTFVLFEKQFSLLIEENNQARWQNLPDHLEIMELIKVLENKLDLVKKQIENQLSINNRYEKLN